MAVRSTREAREGADSELQHGEVPGPARGRPPVESGPVGPMRLPGEPEPASGASAVRGRLEVILHDAQGRERMIFPLTAATTTIGRDPLNTIVIDSPVIPPFYAAVERNDDGQPRMVLRDGATALYYRGEKVNEHSLSNGDTLRAGDPNGSVVTFVYDETPGSAPVERSAYGRHISLTPGSALTIGRDSSNQIVLDGEDVAPEHAHITTDAGGQATITGLPDTSGTFVNGLHVENARLAPGAEVRIGSHRFVYTGTELTQYDDRQNVRIDAIDVTQSVHVGGIGPVGGRTKVLLDSISLTILPGTFVAIVGASGSGKTTLLGALNGQRPMKSGTVLYNGENFYENAGQFCTSLGYVPQDDIVHKNLSVEKALFYAARLRLPKGTTRRQIKQRISDVLDAVEMVPQRKQLISKLSGGQRKRVNIALELLASPAVFYLDEPTSGLDPGLDRKMMQLLRRLADRGHTVVLTTHATTNINIADYVCFLAPGGRLAFFGTPQELLRHFEKTDYAEIYNEVDADPGTWMARFRQSPEFLKYIEGPRLQSGVKAEVEERATHRRRHTQTACREHQVRQFRLLTQRYFNLLWHDRVNLLILLLQAPIIAGFIVILASSNSLHTVSTPADLIHSTDYDAQRSLFIVAASAIWFGIINAAREIVKEEPIYRRERAINLGVVPYVLSKVVVLGCLCIIQDYLLLLIVGQKTGYPTHGAFFGGTTGAFGELYISLLLGSLVGLMLGLLVSALAPNTDRAVSIVPIVLIPQIIFSNVIFTLSGTFGTWISYVMPARWTMEALGSSAHLHNRFALQPHDFYVSDAGHVLGWWGALLLLAVVFFLITLFFQRRKDVLH